MISILNSYGFTSFPPRGEEKMRGGSCREPMAMGRSPLTTAGLGHTGCPVAGLSIPIWLGTQSDYGSLVKATRSYFPVQRTVRLKPDLFRLARTVPSSRKEQGVGHHTGIGVRLHPGYSRDLSQEREPPRTWEAILASQSIGNYVASIGSGWRRSPHSSPSAGKPRTWLREGSRPKTSLLKSRNRRESHGTDTKERIRG